MERDLAQSFDQESHTDFLEASLRAGVVGDLIRSYALHEQASFHWVTIGEGVELQAAEVFDPADLDRAPPSLQTRRIVRCHAARDSGPFGSTGITQGGPACFGSAHANASQSPQS